MYPYFLYEKKNINLEIISPVTTAQHLSNFNNLKTFINFSKVIHLAPLKASKFLF